MRGKKCYILALTEYKHFGTYILSTNICYILIAVKTVCNLWIDRTYFVRMEIYIRHSVRVFFCYTASCHSLSLYLTIWKSLLSILFWPFCISCWLGLVWFGVNDGHRAIDFIRLPLFFSVLLFFNFVFVLFCKHFIYVRYYLLFALNVTATLYVFQQSPKMK